jgi:nitronate monooxygenase
MTILRSIRNTERVRRNRDAESVLELESKGATLEELLPNISGKVGREAYLSGDLEKGVIACGQVVGLIEDIPTVKELIDRIIAEATEICKKLGKLV